MLTVRLIIAVNGDVGHRLDGIEGTGRWTRHLVVVIVVTSGLVRRMLLKISGTLLLP